MLKQHYRLCALSLALAFASGTAPYAFAEGAAASGGMQPASTVADAISALTAPIAAATAKKNAESAPSTATTTNTVPGVAGPLSADVKDTSPKSLLGLALPAPPPAASFTNDPEQVRAQAELQAEAQTDAEKLKRDETHNRKAFDRASGGLLPLAPDQIREFMHKMEAADEAARPSSYGTPKADVRITTVSLDPGAMPPIINLQAGYVTTINIVDATGEPWPILDVGVGGSFEVNPTRSGSHVVRVMPLANVADGNLSVILKDLSTPVIFRLSAGNHQVDMRYDARIPKFGPGAKVPLIDRPRLEAGDETMLLLLQNAPPKDAKRVSISGLDSRSTAWTLGGHTYVRTSLTLLSPAWNASVSSDDGMTIYEIGDAPVLLMSDNGAMIRAKLLRDSDHD